MGMTIALFAIILLGALLVDWRVLIQDGSVKVWSIYGGLTLIGIALVIVSLIVGHDLNMFAPITRALHPISRWVFQTR
ncbi:MAG: hypothetical protein OWT28_06070 [Firmicutes bacterium]|nr:hypothetical protein [Bacillota bacterium]